MKYVNGIILALGLSFDVLFATFSQGLGIRKLSGKKLVGISLIITLIQSGCALLAYQMSEQVTVYCEWLDHWISSVLLVIIGAIMLVRSYQNEEIDQEDSGVHYFVILFLSIGVSVDALAIMTTETFTKMNQWIGTIIIMLFTLVAAWFGTWLGHKLGSKYRYKSEFSGGIILMLLAVKILLVGILRK